MSDQEILDLRITAGLEVEVAIELDQPSPFLPGTHIEWACDSTALGWLKTCPRLYQYHMIDGWSGKGMGIHLRFGIEYHQALHDYEKSKAVGMPHDEALHVTIRALLERIHDWNPSPRTPSEEKKSKDALLRSIIWYVEKFKDDPAKTLILDTGQPAMELSFRFNLDWGPGDHVEPPQPYVLCGHLDRIVEYQGETFVMDRKTSSGNLTSRYFDQFDLSNQMTLYTIAAGVVLEANIRGVIIDAVYVPKEVESVRETTRIFERGFTYRTPDQLDEWLKDLEYWLNLAESYATANHWPMNDTACDKFGGCAFREVCSKSPQVRDAFLRSNFEKGRAWNPLITRE